MKSFVLEILQQLKLPNASSAERIFYEYDMFDLDNDDV